MIKNIQLLIYSSIIAAFVLSCEDDFSNIDSSIKGEKNFNAKSKTFPLLSYTKSLEPVQTNYLPANVLGIYNDGNYGTTTASIVTQVVPATLNPDFGEEPKILSVELIIPYFSTQDGKDGDANKYILDSLYGNVVNTYKLSVYENKYLLRDLDPDTGYKTNQAYYANEMPKIEANKGKLIAEKTTFTPSNLEITLPKTNATKDDEELKKISPALKLNLKKDGDTFWEDLIFANQGKQVLANVDSFKNFFRGIILKPELTGSKGNAILLNFANTNAGITIYYTNKENKDITTPLTYKLNFAGQRFNTFENDFSIPEGNTTNGDDVLYLKGMQGSMAVLDLFNGTLKNDENKDQNALEYFKSKKDAWLINEATLTLHVDQTNTSEKEPDRLFLYDLKNNTPIVDYALEQTVNNPTLSKLKHSVPLERDATGKGIKYKIRLTKHLQNILKNDSINTKLGVYLTNNINVFANSKVFGVSQDNTIDIVNKVPKTSVIYPLGTQIHGSKSTTPENKRLELKIYYTESKN